MTQDAVLLLGPSDCVLLVLFAYVLIVLLPRAVRRLLAAHAARAAEAAKDA